LSRPTSERPESPYREAGLDYVARNKESVRAAQRKWRIEHPEETAAIAKRFRESHPEKVRSEKAEYFQANKKAIIRKQIARYASDPRFRIEMLLRGRINVVIRRQKTIKAGRTMELIGCTLEHLRSHIESQFTEGMSWDAFNRGEIHLDHRRPCRSYDLTDPVQQRECFHFSNLQPLWAVDNMKKSDQLPDGSRARDSQSWEKEWVGMPEFVQEKQREFVKIVVRFGSQEDLDDFCRLIGQRLTSKSQSTWHPELPKSSVVKKYVV
jgi:hypothetical protein